MGYPTKIATCCYCGSRAALVLGKDRHELTCSTCGAPLHDMKRLRKETKSPAPRKTYPPAGAETPSHKYAGYPPPTRRKKVKKRKGLMRHLLEEAFDVIEDIFD